MPLMETSGNVTADAYAGGVAVKPKYIEDYFSTWLYSGSGAGVSQTITNGIDLSTKGGLVWIKDRNSTVSGHGLWDTIRGVYKFLVSSSTGAQVDASGSGLQYGVGSFNTNGFTLPTPNQDYWNASGTNYVSWSFAKAPKFFDVVTYTGTGSAQAISHNLGSVPGCMIVKRTDTTASWAVYHTGIEATSGLENKGILYLNLTNAVAYGTSPWNATAPTSTQFTVGYAAETNASGGTYVAYLFAHNAGGFGLTGTDNVISCGSFTEVSSIATVNLGWEPQWVLIKSTTSVDNWYILDNMRGVYSSVNTPAKVLSPNTSGAESSGYYIGINATGFDASYLSASNTYIYIAIRRGPMKVPTDATKVFNTMLVTGNGTNERQITGVGFPPDLLIGKRRSSALLPFWFDKLRGKERYIDSSSTSAETALTAGNEGLMLQDGFVIDNNYGSLNVNGSTYADWVMRRAPSFFDEVCYTGNGTSGTTKNHNLGVVPELVILKDRSAVQEWRVMCAYYNNNVDPWSYRMALNTTGGISAGAGVFNDTAPTASVFTLGNNAEVNASGDTYVAYLFATCAGVSKVGSYTGNGTTQTINCGFGAGGARFVLIKRTDSTGGWYVYDTARGMTTLVDPYLFLNSTAAESATLGSVTTVSTGFAVNASILAAINTNGASYIFLAIA